MVAAPPVLFGIITFKMCKLYKKNNAFWGNYF